MVGITRICQIARERAAFFIEFVQASRRANPQDAATILENRLAGVNGNGVAAQGRRIVGVTAVIRERVGLLVINVEAVAERADPNQAVFRLIHERQAV